MSMNDLRYFIENDKIEQQIYYHYTTIDALYSIVDEKTFWLTSLESSNDKKELYYNTNNFLVDFHKICVDENDQKTKQYFEIIENSIQENKEKFEKACKYKSSGYALCLSEKKDNLTHWDRYANNCTGVCIGFNVASLEVLIRRFGLTVFGLGIYDIGKILYSKEEQKQFIKQVIINEIKKYAFELSNNIDVINDLKNNGYIYAAVICKRLGKFVKDLAYIDEDEVRVYHDIASVKDTIRLIKLFGKNIDKQTYSKVTESFYRFMESIKIKEQNFYISKNGIRSYKKLCLEAIWGSGVIPEIILGPMCVQNITELKYFLKANGLEKTKVSISQIPIR